MSGEDKSDPVRALKRTIAQQEDLAEGYDTYFFLARLGSDYNQYHFSWEPFRDLAGPLEKGPNARPILIISDNKARVVPELTQLEEPVPHFQIRVSPSCSAQSIANMWLELLAKDGAVHGRYHEAFDWFLKDLKLSPNDLSEQSQRFLLL